MLFGETVAVYCENHTEHTDTLCGQNVEFVPHRKQITCETWSLTLREEHRLRVFENRVLRKIFGPKRDEVIGGWRKLYNGELHNRISVGKPEGDH
jgi:hypothetical protein